MTERSGAYSGGWEDPASVVIAGGTPAERARLALAIARRVDPKFVWAAVELPDPVQGPGEQAVLQEIPVDQRIAIDPSSAAPLAGSGSVAGPIAPGAEDAGLDELSMQGELPGYVRRLIEGRSRDSPIRAFVLTNPDWPNPVWPVNAGSPRRWLDLLRESAVTVVITLARRPEAGPSEADYVLEITSAGPDSADGSIVRVARGAPPSGPGLFHHGNERSLGQIVRQLT